MRIALLLALIGTPALAHAADNCSEQLAEIDLKIMAVAPKDDVYVFGQGTMEGRLAPRLFVERIEFH